jgi:hypothetical protein
MIVFDEESVTDDAMRRSMVAQLHQSMADFPLEPLLSSIAACLEKSYPPLSAMHDREVPSADEKVALRSYFGCYELLIAIFDTKPFSSPNARPRVEAILNQVAKFATATSRAALAETALSISSRALQAGLFCPAMVEAAKACIDDPRSPVFCPPPG